MIKACAGSSGKGWTVQGTYQIDENGLLYHVTESKRMRSWSYWFFHSVDKQS